MLKITALDSMGRLVLDEYSYFIGYLLVIFLINFAIEVWFVREFFVVCMWGSWETNCLIFLIVLALCFF